MDNIDIYTQIEAYLNGELEGEELQKFEQQIKTDTSFAAQVAQHRELEEMLIGLEIDNWRQRAEILLEEKKAKISPKIKSLQTKNARSKGQYFLKAAAVFLLVAGLAYFYTSRPTIAPEQLAMSYFEQTEASIYGGIERGDAPSNENEQLLNTAHQQYQQNNYQQAATTLSKVGSSSPLYPESTLLIGLCQLHLQQYSEAIQSFQTVANHSNTLSQEEANWLLALAHLQNGDREIGKKQLENIAAAKGGFSKQAASLLEGF